MTTLEQTNWTLKQESVRSQTSISVFDLFSFCFANLAQPFNSERVYLGHIVMNTVKCVGTLCGFHMYICPRNKLAPIVNNYGGREWDGGLHCLAYTVENECAIYILSGTGPNIANIQWILTSWFIQGPKVSFSDYSPHVSFQEMFP